MAADLEDRIHDVKILTILVDMRYIIILISVLLVGLLVFQNYDAHRRGVPGAANGDADPVAARQKAIDVNQFVKDTAESQRRAIDEQLQ